MHSVNYTKYGFMTKIAILSFSLSACSMGSVDSLYTLYAITIQSPVDKYSARYIKRNADIIFHYDERQYPKLLRKVEAEAVEQKQLDDYQAYILIEDHLNKRHYRVGLTSGCRYFIVTDRKKGICSFVFYTRLLQPVVNAGNYFNVDESGRPVK